MLIAEFVEEVFCLLGIGCVDLLRSRLWPT